MTTHFWKVSGTNLISSVVHFHIVTVHIQLHVLVAKHCGRFRISVITSHVIGQHENYVAANKESTD